MSSAAPAYPPKNAQAPSASSVQPAAKAVMSPSQVQPAQEHTACKHEDRSWGSILRLRGGGLCGDCCAGACACCACELCCCAEAAEEL